MYGSFEVFKVLTRHSTWLHRVILETSSPHTPHHRAHTQGSFVEISKSTHSSSTGSTHRRTLKTQNHHTPQHRAQTHGNFKTQSFHTPQHRAHTHVWELWKLKVLTRHNTGPIHRVTLETPSPHTSEYKYRRAKYGTFVAILFLNLFWN